jgi:dipeptidyl-peptidase-3
MRIKYSFIALIIMSMLACQGPDKDTTGEKKDFQYVLEQFADLRILRYEVTGFESLSLPEKQLVYYLSQAALCGRDILWDQNGEYNLAVRKALENIYITYSGNKTSDEFKKFETYLKRIWFSNGIYHHYASTKIIPEFGQEYFRQLVAGSEKTGFPQVQGKSTEESLSQLEKVIFDPEFQAIKVSQNTDQDIVTGSAVNFYRDVTEAEVVDFYSKQKDKKDLTPISYGLNSRVVKKEDGQISEGVWKSGGLYGTAIDQIIFWLEKAQAVAQNPDQMAGIEKLIAYYKSGDLSIWDEYNIIWVSDTSRVDFINGFIEVYNDPLGLKGTWESVVNFKDIKATRRTETIATNAQWFEDNSPVDERFRKKEVKGVSAKVITVAMLGGDCYPATPIGINLPNADWIRKDHGSKSVTLENITYAYNQASLGSGFLEEFSYNDEELQLVKKYGPVTDNLHTDLHECLGHGSGQLLPGVSTEALKNYQSPLEETRADLFALYYIMDPKLVELGLLPDHEAAKAQYISYIRNGMMTQLRRIEPGNDIAQAHMRNRQLISSWCYEKGEDENIIEKIQKDGKTYFHINDFEALRALFGTLLIEVQRIKSEGDYEAGKNLVETYGVKVDQVIHTEVLERFRKLNIAPYSGFVNPEYTLVEEDGKVVDIVINYVTDYSEQMLKYSREYSYLPIYND